MSKKSRLDKILTGTLVVMVASITIFYFYSRSEIKERSGPAGKLIGFHLIEGMNDYSYLNSFNGKVYASHPGSAEEVARAVRMVIKDGGKLRIRGRGHSMNGISLPKKIESKHENPPSDTREHMIITDQLDYYHILGPDKVKLGAGIAIVVAKAYLAQLGLGVRIVNNGEEVGPSVGGFVAASGFSNMSKEFGGYWETVEAMTIVDGTGAIRTLSTSDPEFKWLFGSMGQLAIIVDVTLKVDTLETFDQSNIGKKGRIAHQVYEPTPKYKHDTTGLFWFSIFMPVDKEDDVRNKMQEIMDKHPNTLDYLSVYRYPITFKNFNPPLLYPHNESFLTLGIWGRPASYEDKTSLNALEQSVQTLVTKDPDLYRYIQTEYISDKRQLSSYFSDEIRKEFAVIKKRLDPEGLFPDFINAH